MAECKEAYDSGDYQRFIDIGVEDPNTGGPLFAAIHNEGCGATIVSQDQYPDSYGEPETMADTINALQPKIDEAAGAMLSAYQPFIGDVQLSQAIASINLFSPTALDA